MSWIVEPKSTQPERAETFKRLINQPELLKIPGTHDGISAKIARDVGFQAIYLSGAAYTASRALPDLGLIYSNEMAEKAQELIRASDLPLLVDIDTGYGGVINVARAAREMVEAGVAAVQIEDQLLPKKCGHLNGKKLIEPEEMMQKIRTIREVAPTLVIVARTDAKSVEGMEKAMERANMYVEAGADAIFPEALTSEEDFRQASSAINAPLLANMTEFGKTPYFTGEDFLSFGMSMVIYPVTSLRVAAKAYERVFTEIMEHDTQKEKLEDMQSRQELYETIKYYDYEALDEKVAKTVLPEIGKENK
ncbi:methylisocitrate lyase [Sediminibacillus dalangtanensis]|uniref:Methylisocitrate lyase n=1 Tax=Sediminibacillus dalangtanensis TaxID=2729421 RepID=A0ABX7VV05_9BACI|nr:methylisocitrate lyase [Sediminibacillus dalangtanensis]QTM98172.1 methylisocitrate lyase [Sediminibacillus dalangtanensis]